MCSLKSAIIRIQLSSQRLLPLLLDTDLPEAATSEACPCSVTQMAFALEKGCTNIGEQKSQVSRPVDSRMWNCMRSYTISLQVYT